MTADLLTGLDTAPGRHRTYLEEPWKETLPHSCELHVYQNVLFPLIEKTTLGLKGGAGIKIVLDTFQKRLTNYTQWCFQLNEEHPDFDKQTKEQKSTHISTWEPQTRIVVQDSLKTLPSNDGSVGIIESWKLFIEALEDGKSVCVDLSALRPAGSVNDKGLVATGPVGYGSEKDNESSFWAVYYYIAKHIREGDVFSLMQLLGCLNDTLRRGGFKRGIVCSSLTYKNPNIIEYLTCDITNIPGSHKKSVKVDEGILDDKALTQLLCDQTNSQGVFWERILENGRHINVCVGIKIFDAGTCLIWRLNLGLAKTLVDVVNGMESATLNCLETHTTWREKVGTEKSKNVLNLAKDNQIAVDVMGLANMLRIWEITYEEFNEALVRAVIFDELDQENKANRLVTALAKAYQNSCRVADEYMDAKGLPRLDYIHTVEPAQSHSYETKDADGFTTCRGIWPPFAKRTRRRSNTNRNIVVKHGEVEVATDFSPDFNFILCNNYYKFMKKFGRPHAISVDDWGDATPERFEWWLTKLELPSKYYSESSTYKEQSALRKRAVVTEPQVCNALRPEECTVCAE